MKKKGLIDVAENGRGKAATSKKNLIPQNRRTKEEQREIAKMGGKASGEVRKARKTLREELLLLLADGDTQKNVTLAMLEKALSGDVRAFEVIRDTIGEKPVDKQIIDATVMSDSDRKLLAKIENRLDIDTGLKTHK